MESLLTSTKKGPRINGQRQKPSILLSQPLWMERTPSTRQGRLPGCCPPQEDGRLRWQCSISNVAWSFFNPFKQQLPHFVFYFEKQVQRKKWHEQCLLILLNAIIFNWIMVSFRQQDFTLSKVLYLEAVLINTVTTQPKI